MLQKKDIGRQLPGGRFRAVLALLLLVPTLICGSAFAAPPGGGGAATKKLSFQASPNTAELNKTWSIVKVAVLNADGTVNSKDSKTKITLSLVSGATGKLAGTLIKTVASGVASFSDLSYNKGETITIKAVSSDTTITSAVSPAINVIAPALSFQTQPSSPQVVGKPWASFPVQVLINGAVDTTDNTTRITLATVSGSGVLSGTLTKTVVRGVATFGDISYGKAETIQVKATPSVSTTLPATSNPVQVNAPVLSFRTQPGPTQRVGRGWAPFSVQITLAGSVDIYDNTTQVTLTTVPDGRGPMLGTLTKTVVNGVATFDNISDNVAGLPYAILASAPATGASAATSSQVSVFTPYIQFGVLPASPQVAYKLWTPPFTVQVMLNGAVDNVDNGTPITASVYSDTLNTGYSVPTKTTVKGIATFDGAYCNTPGWAHVIASVNSSIPFIGSGSIQILGSWSATFATFPGNQTAQKIWTPFTVAIKKSGITDTADNTTIVSLSVNSGTGLLSGTTAKRVIQGIATFDSVSYNIAENMTLQIQAQNDPRISSSVTGVLVLSIDHLAFGIQPPSTVTMGGIWPSFTVRKLHDTVQDNTDNVTRVTLSIPEGNLPLSGTLTKTVVAGVATFNDISFSSADSVRSFSLLAAGSDNAGVTSVRSSLVTANARFRVLSLRTNNSPLGVSVLTPFTGLFSEPVNPSTVDQGSFYVMDMSGVKVPGSYTFADNNATCILTPAAPLAGSTNYMVVFGTGLKGISGDNLRSESRFPVMTGAFGWVGAGVLSLNQYGNRNPDLAADDAGPGMIVWQQDNVSGQNLVRAVWFNGMSSAFPETIAGGSAPKSFPQVVTNGPSGATAIWVENETINAKRYGRNGTTYWDNATATRLSDPMGGGSAFSLSARDNAVAVAWSQIDNNAGTIAIWSNYFIDDPLSGTTGPVGSIGRYALDPRTAMDAAGNITIIWDQCDNTVIPAINQYDQPFLPGSAWGTPRLVPGAISTFCSAGSIAVSASGNGDRIVAWADNNVVKAGRYTVAGGWESPVALSPWAAGVDTKSVLLGNDVAGNAVAVWAQSSGIETDIWASLYTAGAGWSGAQVISDNSYACDMPALAMDSRSPSGIAVATWRRYNGSAADGHSIWAAYYNPATGWEAPHMLHTGTGSFDPPKVAVDGNGYARVVWSYNGEIITDRYVPIQ